MDLLARMATFVRIVESGSLSKAARAERLSLPAVSRQLRALEQELGSALVVRSTRRLSITDAGRRFYEHCLRVLAEVDRARATVREARDVRGTITVSAPVTFGVHSVVPLLPKLAERHPELTVELRLEDHLVDVVSEGVDLAIRGGAPPPDSTDFVAHELREFRRVVVAAPGYLRRHGSPRTPEELVRHACLVQLGDRCPLGSWSLVRDDRDVTIRVDGALRTTAPLALLELARAGMGLALLPDWLVADDLATLHLKRVLDPWQSPLVGAWAFHRVELRQSAKIQAFLDVLRECQTK
jgi:DNA-binding transcriptional LysR family regulator